MYAVWKQRFYELQSVLAEKTIEGQVIHMRDWIKLIDAQEKKDNEMIAQNISDMQERNMFPRKFSFPLTLQFELTSHCNVKCKHCYNNSGAYNNGIDRMTPEEWITFSKYLVEKGGIFECILSGGEPLLLGKELYNIMDILHMDGTQFLLITNGYLLDKEAIRCLEKYRYHWIQVSIDGYTKEYHDAFRNKQGSWERAVSGAVGVAEAGLPLTIAHSVTKENLKDIDNMCGLAYDMGAGSIIVGEVNFSGRMYDNLNLALNNEDKNYLYEKVEENYKRYEGKMVVRRSGTVKNQLERYRTYPTNGAIIRPNGDVRLDCMTPFVMGNVLDNDFTDIWLEKSLDCWNDSRVRQYIDSYNDASSDNVYLKNYVDKDIIL